MKPMTRKAAATLTMVGPAAVNDETHETHDKKGSGNVDDGRVGGGKQSELERSELRE